MDGARDFAIDPMAGVGRRRAGPKKAVINPPFCIQHQPDSFLTLPNLHHRQLKNCLVLPEGIGRNLTAVLPV